MFSPKRWLLVLLLNVLQFALSVDAKGGGKSSSPKSSKNGSKSKPGRTSQTVAYRSNGQCYNDQNVLIQCPSNKATIITTIVLGTIAGLLILVALSIWLFNRYRPKKSGRSLDTESKGIHDGPEDSHSSAPLVHGETHEKDGKVDEYDSDDEGTYYERSDDKVSKY